MSTVVCASCEATISDQAGSCPHCGHPVKPAVPIRRIGGKLLAGGVVILVAGILASMAGGWWGPAMLFPGAAIFALGYFFERERPTP